VTVEAAPDLPAPDLPAPGFPAAIPAAHWSAVEVRDAAPAGRRRIVIAPEVMVPAGYELRLYSGPVAAGTTGPANRVMQPGEVFTTQGSLAVGTTCHNLLHWRRIADDAWIQATENVISFEIRGLEPVAPLPVAPVLVAAPALAGSGRIGDEHRLEAGTWSGEPAPTLAFQWLRGDAAIAGASTVTYVPVPADDGQDLRGRVTATNAAGSLSAETAPVRIRFAPPSVTVALVDEIFDEGTGPQEVPTAQAFAGEALRFVVSGAGATIDATSGLVTIPTDKALSDEVRVAASNSGGMAEASFRVTVEAAAPDLPEPGFPAAIPAAHWSAVEVRDAAPAGRRRIAITPAVTVPAGYELRLYSGPVAGGTTGMGNRVMQSGEVFTTQGSLAVGSTCHNLLYWRRVSDDAWIQASENQVSFEIRGLETVAGGTTSSLPRETAVSQYGLGFQFSEATAVGQYCSGDWFAKGPLTVTSMSPASGTFGGRVMHGAMIDPGRGGGFAGPFGQGHDSASTNAAKELPYVADLNVDPGATGRALSFTAQQSASIYKARSAATPGGDGARMLTDGAVLTVLPQAYTPPAGAFRPAAARADKTSHWTEGDLNYSVFPSLDLSGIAGTPTIERAIQFIRRPHRMHNTQNQFWNVNPTNNQMNYGREYAQETATAALMLCGNLTQAQKREILIPMVQLGIDIYGRFLEGGVWEADGGLNCGRKLPLVIAAVALGDPGMLNAADATKNHAFGDHGSTNAAARVENVGPRFHEDRQTTVVQPFWVNEYRYPQNLVGRPEWTIRYLHWWSKPNPNLQISYRDINAAYQLGTALAANLIRGARAAWNHPPFFDYADFRRNWMLGLTGTNAPIAFHKNMWNRHRGAGGPLYPAA
jgi:hypothetical protein